MCYAPDGRRSAGATAVPPGAAAATSARLLAVMAALALAAAPLGAQPSAGSFSFDGHGGLGFAASDLDEVTRTGGVVGFGVAWHFTRNLALRGGLDIQLMQGGSDGLGVTYPDMDIVHATAGIELNLFDEEGGTPWIASVGVGAGASRLELARTLDGGGEPPLQLEFRQTYPSFRGAVKLGRRLTRAVAVYLEPAAYLILADREETSVLAEVSESPEIRPFDATWAVPLTAGVRVTLP